MLNDSFISRDVISYLQNYLQRQQLSFPNYQKKLTALQPKKQMSFEQWWRLLDELSTLHPLPALGLDIGKTVKVKDSGVLGYLFRTSSTVAEGLACFIRFQRLIYAGSLASFTQTDQQTVSVSWNPDHGYSSQLSDEFLLSAMVNITREITSPQTLNLAEVCFTQALEPQHIDIYENYFDCPIKINQQKLTISFHQSTLAQEIVHHDEALHSLLGKQAEIQLTELPESDLFLSELTDMLIKSLHEGSADASSVAKKLNISDRSLHRKLKQKKRIYRDILKDTRKLMATNYLGDEKLTLVEIALLLGYSEQSTFTRAFHTWFGYSPLAYKKRYL